MKGLQRKCLIGSVLFHGLLLVLVVVGSAFIPKNPPSPPPPAFEVFDAQSILVDQPNVVSGGNPNVTAPPVTAPPTLVPAPQPVAPRVEEVKPPTKLPDPPPEAEAKKPEKKSQPEPEPIKPERSKKLDPDAFDFDKAVTKTPQTKNDKTDKSEKEKSMAFDLSKAEKKTIKPLKDAKEASDGEENARGEKEKKLAMARSGAVSDILKNLQGGLSKGGTSFDIPGPGGAAYASYDLYLKGLYEKAWVPPQAGRGNEPVVEVEITIARNGEVLGHRILKASGRRELDNSVNTVLHRIKQVRPLPEGGTDPKRTFRINFNLTETPSVG